MLALYDIDGTLIRTAGAGARAMARACAELHGMVDAAAGVHMAGKTDPIIIEEIFVARIGRAPTARELAALVEVYLGHLERELAAPTTSYRVLPGVEDSIAACAERGAAIGLATGNVEAGARIKLERGGLWSRFGFGGYGSDHADRAELVARAVERGEAMLGRRVDRREVLVIGDTPRDVAAARANGAVAVAVATGGATRAELAASAPDVLLDTLEELRGWLATR
jgi:phosphoglycolate phosphatase-like HAD superfamily hydrolase